MTITTITPRPTRRALARGVAWSAPAMVLGAMAPMAAASHCVSGRYTMNWTSAETTVDAQESGGSTRCDGVVNFRDQITEYPAILPTFNTVIDTTRTGTIATGGATDSVTCVSGVTYPTDSKCHPNFVPPPNACQFKDGANLVTQTQTPANTAWTWSTSYPTIFSTAADSALALGWNNLNGSSSANNSCWTFTFSCPVVNLKFVIGDIDYANTTLNTTNGDTKGDGNREYVYLTSGSTYTTTQGSQVGGSGTATSPWRPLANSNLSPLDATGGVVVEFTQAVSTFTICAWSAATTYRTSENIFLSPLVFDCTATCP